MEPSLREPVMYPNWVWVLGGALILFSLIWLLGLIIGYRSSRIRPSTDRTTLSAARRARYERLISEVEEGFENGELSVREAHLAVAAIIRAAATERTGNNIESLTVEEVGLYQQDWPELGQALAWCEEPSFAAIEEARHIADGAAWARVVVG